MIIGSLSTLCLLVLKIIGGNPAVNGKRNSKLTWFADKQADKPGRRIYLSVIYNIYKAGGEDLGFKYFINPGRIVYLSVTFNMNK